MCVVCIADCLFVGICDIYDVYSLGYDCAGCMMNAYCLGYDW